MRGERVKHEEFTEWRGKDLVDRDGDKIGKLQDVYVDVETDEAMFGTVPDPTVAVMKGRNPTS